MKKFFAILFAFAPAFLFAAELKVSVYDKELEIPLEGVKISIKENSSIAAQTDENGEAPLVAPDNIKSGTIEAILPGYQSVSVKFTAGDRDIKIMMAMDGAIEGQTLVVNRTAPDGAEEKTGVSTVMSKERMHSTANMGLMEDCMCVYKR